MNLPKNGRVVIIDDKPEEGLPLLKVLSQQKISATYFTGRLEELPKNPFNDVRIVFLDIILEGITSRDEKTVLSTLFSTVERIVSPESGPFILAIWTKHEEYLDRLKKTLKEKGYQAIILDLNKKECKKATTDEYDFKKIRTKIEERLKNIGIFDIFLLWENIVHDSASVSINEFSRFIDFNDKWNDEMLKIFYNLAKGWAGKMLNTESTEEIVKNALFSFKGIFEDFLEKNIKTGKYIYDIGFSSENTISENIIGEINSKLLLDTTTSTIFYPGNVYKENNDEIINGILNEDNSTHIEVIKNNSVPISVEISPICDFVQNKIKKSRFIKGILLPKEIDHKGKNIHLWKKIKKALYIYESPALGYKEQLYKMVLDFRYFSSCPLDEIQSKKPIFRIRKELLTDIQIKLSSHINRAGVLFLE